MNSKAKEPWITFCTDKERLKIALFSISLLVLLCYAEAIEQCNKPHQYDEEKLRNLCNPIMHKKAKTHTYSLLFGNAAKNYLHVITHI